MNLSEPFIRRPVMTAVLTVSAIVFGVLAYFALPVNDLPAVDYPVIQVNVGYPGATPETMANNVATPLERQFMQIPGLQLVTSNSGQGHSSFVLQFDLSKSVDAAATDVQAAITRATAQLPVDLPSPPTFTKTNPNDQPIMYVGITSDSATQGQLFDYANTQVGERISILPGVSQVAVYGAQSAVRIKADPSAMAARSLTIDDLTAALKNGTSYTGAGEFDSAAGATIRTALEPLAQPHGDGDDRGREHRNADALVELAGHCLDTAAVPQHGSVRPHVQVTTTLETLQGLIGAPAGEMALSLPISAKTVQRIACDSSVTRVLLGTDSAMVDAGRAKRVVSGGSRRLLDARDKHCRWPGCERPASWSSAHHVIHWAQGGKTDLSNMILLCQHHHWMVHEGGWRLSLAADARVIAVPPETDFYPPEFYPSARAPDEFDVA